MRKILSFFFPSKKKQYFQRKIRQVYGALWDMEFKRFKLIELREEVRQDYDDLKSKLSNIEKEIKDQEKNPTLGIDERARLDDQKDILERDISRRQEQMVDLDVEVHGRAPNQEDHAGVTGVNEQIEGFQELIGLLKDYSKKL